MYSWPVVTGELRSGVTSDPNVCDVGWVNAEATATRPAAERTDFIILVLSSEGSGSWRKERLGLLYDKSERLEGGTSDYFEGMADRLATGIISELHG